MAVDRGRRGQARWWGDPISEFGWPIELARLLRSPVYRGLEAPGGDGSPVLVLPGFAASDASGRVLRGWLRRIGYVPFSSNTLFNVDCSDRVFRRLERRLAEIARSTKSPVSMIGHSRGGQLARALAARHPERVSSVVVLGAGLNDPFAISVPLAAAVAVVRGYHQRVTDRSGRRGCLTNHCACRYGESFRAPLPDSVPLTSIRAARDGVMSRRACIVAGARNIEVDATHTGLPFSQEAYRAIAAALCQR